MPSEGHTVLIQRIDVSADVIPTDFPEPDGTLEWTKTTLVVVEITAGDVCGVGYTYADTATVRFIHDLLVDIVVGQDAMAIPGTWVAMVCATRNLGRPGITSMAVAGVDVALWDLKARLLSLLLVTLLARVGVQTH